ncbi:hypothetical protein CRG98_001452, partial [Punica granatum]
VSFPVPWESPITTAFSVLSVRRAQRCSSLARPFQSRLLLPSLSRDLPRGSVTPRTTAIPDGICSSRSRRLVGNSPQLQAAVRPVSPIHRRPHPRPDNRRGSVTGSLSSSP